MKYSYYIENIMMEILDFELKENLSFSEDYQYSEYKEYTLDLYFSRELSLDEEAELSGYVNNHTPVKILGEKDIKYKKESYDPSGKLLKIEFFNKKDNENYLYKIKQLIYKYNTKGNPTGYTEEKTDILGRIYHRIEYRLFSDPITKEVYSEEVVNG